MNNDYEKYPIFGKCIHMRGDIISASYSGYKHLFYVQSDFLSNVKYELQLGKHNHF